MIHIDSNGKGHFKGDAVRLTGRKDDTTYSIVLHELEFTSGRFKGEKIWNVIYETGVRVSDNLVEELGDILAAPVN